jgi:redox-sensitive bicupin YhaK (pirin superfamily)
MTTLRSSYECGHVRHGRLESDPIFSFADYDDRQHLKFRTLCVINADRVQPGKRFAPHSHRDREIVCSVLAGTIEHRDSLSTGLVMICPGDVQRMSAGTGVTRSEFNPSKGELVTSCKSGCYGICVVDGRLMWQYKEERDHALPTN